MVLVGAPAGVCIAVAVLAAAVLLSAALGERVPYGGIRFMLETALEAAVMSGCCAALVLTDELARHVRIGARLGVVVVGVVLLPFLIAAGSAWVEAREAGRDPYQALGHLLGDLPRAIREIGAQSALMLLPFGLIVAARAGAVLRGRTMGIRGQVLLWAIVAPIAFALAALSTQLTEPEFAGRPLQVAALARSAVIALAMVSVPLGLALGDRVDARVVARWRRWGADRT
jgi:hypothetical protein